MNHCAPPLNSPLTKRFLQKFVMSLLVAFCGTVCVEAQAPEEKPGEPSKKNIFSDRFSENSLKQYHTNGAIEWAEGSLKMTTRSAVTRLLPDIHRFEVKIDLASIVRSSVERNAEFNLNFNVGEKGLCGVTVRIDPKNKDHEIIFFGEFYGSRKILRAYAITGNPAGSWSVRYDHGLLTLSLNGAPPAIAYADAGYAPVSAMTFGIMSGRAECIGLECISLDRGNGKEKKGSEAQRKKLTTLTRQEQDLQLHGDTRKASEAASEALKLSNEIYGTESLQSAAMQNRLGTHLAELGDYAQARKHLELALAIYERQLDDTHPDIAAALSGLAGLLVRQRDFQAALPLYERIATIAITTLGEDDPRTGTAYSYLGGVLGDMGRRRESIPYLRKYLESLERQFEADDRHLAQPLLQLGGALSEAGDAQAGLTMIKRSVAIAEASLGPHELELARGWSTLGLYLSKSGKDKEALEYYAKALPVCRQTVGSHHLYTGIVMENQAHSLWCLGQKREALKTMLSVWDLQVKNALTLAPRLSDAEGLVFTKKLANYLNACFSMADRIGGNENDILYANVCDLKGLSRLTMSGGVKPSLAKAADPDLFKELQAVRSFAAALTYHKPSADRGKQQELVLKTLMTERESMQRRLRDRTGMPETTERFAAVIEKIGQTFPEDTVVVDFIQIADYDPAKKVFDGGRGGERVIEAFIIRRRNGAPKASVQRMERLVN